MSEYGYWEALQREAMKKMSKDSEWYCARKDIGNECMCEKCINDYMGAVAAMDGSDFE